MAREDKGARLTSSNHTSPAVGSISFSTERPIVLLPEPDSPTRPSTSPLAISKLTSSTARTGRLPWPKYFLRPRTASIGALTTGSWLIPIASSCIDCSHSGQSPRESKDEDDRYLRHPGRARSARSGIQFEFCGEIEVKNLGPGLRRDDPTYAKARESATPTRNIARAFNRPH